MTPMSILEEAVVFAAEAHRGRRRRGERVPGILHPMEVAAIVGTMTGSEELLAAAMLLDVLEETGVTPETLRERFGDRVAALVDTVSENRRPPEETWPERKAGILEAVADAEDLGVKLLFLGDSLSNLRSVHRRWRVLGDAAWRDSDQTDPVLQAWYYRSALAVLSEVRSYDAWQELNALVATVFAGVKTEMEELD